MVKSEGVLEKVSIMGVWCGEKIRSLRIPVRQHSASLFMPISDPRDKIFLTSALEFSNMTSLVCHHKTH